MSHILHRTRTREIEVHSDPLCIRPAAISEARKFKINKLEQEELKDSGGGAMKCRFCNPALLDQNVSGQEDDRVIQKHLNNSVISYENASPFLAGDQRLFCMWHEDKTIRYKHAHKFKFSDMTIVEFYYLLKAARDHAIEFPGSEAGDSLQNDENSPIRCIAGFNIGKLAGQSMPHFHLQYGWDVLLPESANLDIHRALINLYYKELEEKSLILWQDDQLYILAPWTPKGQFHMEIHFKNKYELTHLNDDNLKILSYLSGHMLRVYKSLGIRNINIVYSGSPFNKKRMPFFVQYIPRSNTTALYEMVGVSVVDTPPSEIATRFTAKWRDIIKKAKGCDIEKLYAKRFSN